MSLSFGGNNSKSSSTSNLNSTTTTTPNVPSWIQTPATEILGRAGNLMGQPADSLVAPLNAWHNYSADLIGSLGGRDWNFNNAAKTLNGIMGGSAPTVTAASLLEGLNNYMSPYTDSVVRSSTSDFDHQADLDRAQETLDMAAQGVWGGSGAALTRSMGDESRLRSRNTFLSGLRDQAFQTASRLSGEDADRKQSASAQNAQNAIAWAGQQQSAANSLLNLELAYQNNARTNAEASAGIGDMFRNYDTQLRQAPWEQLGKATNIWGGVNPVMFSGQTAQTNSAETSTGKSSGFQWGASIANGGDSWGGGVSGLLKALFA